ncbi:phosphate ABC transporter permease, partial [Cellulomonas bogoriensis 69B4 = DSM 16987]
ATDGEHGGPSAPGSAQEALALATEHGLRRVDSKPGLAAYLRDVWRHRALTVELAKAKAYDRNQNNYLGQLWAALNPLLLVGAYFFVFGFLLDVSRGTDNYVAFLATGIFIFLFIAGALSAGAKAITGHQSLIRSVRFPRAVLPISIAMAETLILLPALGVLLIILPLAGEPIQLEWLLLPAAVVLLFVFCTGLGMLVARAASASRDVLNLVPLVVRLARYVSGVFFSIEAYAPGALGLVMQYQPVAVYLNLVRSCMLSGHPQDPVLWGVAAGWAVLFVVAGTYVFWRAEHRYGRE